MMRMAVLLVLLCAATSRTRGAVVPMRASHQRTAGLCASSGARMPSSNLPQDVDDVSEFFARNPLIDGEEPAHVWTYERRGSACKVIPVCPAGKSCDQRIRVAHCDQSNLSVCLNVPSE